MATRYELRVTSPSGGQVGTAQLPYLDSRGAWQYTRADKIVGTATITLPLDTYPRTWFRQDYLIGIWRSFDNGPFVLAEDTAWLIDGLEMDADSRALTLTLSDSLALLDRRIVAYAEASAQATKTAVPADDAMKAYVRENLGTLAVDTARALTTGYFTVAGDTSSAATITKAAARQDLLATLKAVADDATGQGTYTTFDVSLAAGQFTFETYTGQRGIDRRSLLSQPLIGPAFGNIRNGKLLLSWRDTANVVYAGGQGEAALELIGVAIDTVRATVSPAARRERWLAARQAKTQGEVNAEAAAGLRAGRTLALFTGDFVDTPACRFGRDLGYGDLVSVQAFGYAFDCRVSAVTVGQTAQGVAILNLGLRGESDVAFD